MQARRVLQGRAQFIEVRRQVGQRIHEHRHVGGGELRCHLPGFGRADQGDAHVARLRPAQQADDVGRALDAHHDASAATEVLRQRAAAGRGEQGELRVRGNAPAHLVDQLVQQHPLRGARAAAEIGAFAAQGDEQGTRPDRIQAAVQPDRAALARDQRAAGATACRQQRPAEAFHAGHRDEDRLRVVGQGDVEFRTHLHVAGAAAQGERGVDRGRFAGDLFHADVGDAGEQRRGQRLALRIDHRRIARSQSAADRGDATVAHQHVARLQRAAFAGGMHGGVADQQVLRRGEAARREQGDEQYRAFHACRAHRTPPRITSCPNRKSEVGCRERSRRSYNRAPSTYTCSACA